MVMMATLCILHLFEVLAVCPQNLKLCMHKLQYGGDRSRQFVGKCEQMLNIII